eukprot:1160546-Pelagomonas_calceolata.AAC.1
MQVRTSDYDEDHIHAQCPVTIFSTSSAHTAQDQVRAVQGTMNASAFFASQWAPGQWVRTMYKSMGSSGLRMYSTASVTMSVRRSAIFSLSCMRKNTEGGGAVLPEGQRCCASTRAEVLCFVMCGGRGLIINGRETRQGVRTVYRSCTSMFVITNGRMHCACAGTPAYAGAGVNWRAARSRSN